MQGVANASLRELPKIKKPAAERRRYAFSVRASVRSGLKTLFQFSRERLKFYRFVAFQIYFAQKSVAVNVHHDLAGALGCPAFNDEHAESL